MKKIMKIAGITLGVILLLLITLPFVFQGKMEKMVKSEGNKMLNAQFDFRSLDISLLPLTSFLYSEAAKTQKTPESEMLPLTSFLYSEAADTISLKLL